MTGTLAEFRQIVDAEAYFEFFQLDFDARIVNVNRLHILKQFANAIQTIDERSPELDEAAKLTEYRVALQQSYEVFLSSNALEQKLFKVFNEKPQNIVMLSEVNVE